MSGRSWLLRSVRLALVFACASVGIVGSTRAAAPSAFQFWTLAITYENEFCSTHNSPRFPECRGGVARLKGLALRGFVPSLDTGSILQDRLEFKREAIGDATIEHLKGVMPSVDCHMNAPYDPHHACLIDREWDLHGRLSGLDADSYFSAAATLAQRFRELPAINRFLAEQQTGSSVMATELTSALQTDLPGAETKLLCEFKNGRRQYLIEIQVALDLNAFKDFPAPASFHMPFPDFPNANPIWPIHYCPTDAPIVIQ